MHEWALAEGVVATALQTAEQEGFQRLTEVVVKIGELQNIKLEVFQQALEAVIPAQESLLQGTEFRLELIPTQLCCRACGHGFSVSEGKTELSPDEAEAIHFLPELAHGFLQCPNCQSPDFQVVDGRGVRLESVEGI
ncbi:MAG: hydrogenase nickel insertion protein HypA [Planctomycetota bacterium]|nr:MAG: hydrogenase nickel insertion protein HypA [Planctomycetota bacterium]